MQHLFSLKAAHKRMAKFMVYVKLYEIISTLKSKLDAKVSQERQRKKLEMKASLIQSRFRFLQH